MSENPAATKDKNPSPPNWPDDHGYRRHWLFPAVITVLVLAGLFFTLGLAAASHRAVRHTFQANRFDSPEFNQRFGSNMMGMRHFGHPTLGVITAISGSSLTLHNSTANNTVNIVDATSIYTADGTVAKASDLKVGDVVSVIGRPGSNGQITATAIRLR